MPRLRSLAARLRAWFGRARMEREFDDELNCHLAMLAEENIRRGMNQQGAERAARVQLGGLTQLQETNRELQGWPWIKSVAQDARHAWRMLRKYPGFTAIALLTLALGIGANTAMFSVVNAVLLKPLPYAQPERLFIVFQAKPQERIAAAGWSYPNLEDFRGQSGAFAGVAGSQHHQLMLSGQGEPALVNASVVTEDFFSVLGDKTLMGRALNTQDGLRGAAPVVVLSEGLWKNTFGGDPGIVGRAINLDRRSFTVVGIMPAEFRYPLNAENEQVWIPLAQDPLFGGWMEKRGGHWLQVVGRLKPGVSRAQAQAELGAVSARLATEFPADNSQWSAGMMPLRQMIVGREQTPLLVLLGAVGLVLLIACANIANLLLARATSRTREMAVRTILGAGRGRLMRQSLIESAVLGLMGGAVGIVAAYWGIGGLSTLLPPALPQVHAIRLDFGVLSFALALTLAAICIFGLAPTLMVANANLHPRLREGGHRAGEGRGDQRVRKLLAAGEIAVALVLLVAAGLLLRSFARLTSVNPGFDARRLVKAEISLPRFQYASPEQWLKFYNELLPQVQAAPGLRDTAVAVPVPLAYGSVNLPFDIVGSPRNSSGTSRTADYVAISPEYFRVMGVAVLAGRIFNLHDDASAAPVAIISRKLARTYFPNQDPIGKQMAFGLPPHTNVAREVVGVVDDVRDVALGQDPGAMMYVPFPQAPFPGVVLVARTSLATSSVAAELRHEVGRFEKDLPVTAVASMSEILDGSVAQPRFRTLLLALFAAMSLLLAASGVFGVISYSVSRRTQEIGIRMAVGATRTAICRLVMGETMKLALAGVVVGIPLSLGASRLVAHLLFGVSPSDPATLAAAAGALAMVAVVAAYVPVRSAMQVDPACALRRE